MQPAAVDPPSPSAGLASATTGYDEDYTEEPSIASSLSASSSTVAIPAPQHPLSHTHQPHLEPTLDIPPALHLLSPRQLYSLAMALCPPASKALRMEPLAGGPQENIPSSRDEPADTTWGEIPETPRLVPGMDPDGPSPQRMAAPDPPPPWLQKILLATASRIAEEMSAAAISHPRSWLEAQKAHQAATPTPFPSTAPHPEAGPPAWPLSILARGLTRPPWGPHALSGSGQALSPSEATALSEAMSRSGITGPGRLALMEQVAALAVSRVGELSPRELASLVDSAATLLREAPLMGADGGSRGAGGRGGAAAAAPSTGFPLLVLMKLSQQVLAGPAALLAAPRTLVQLVETCARHGESGAAAGSPPLDPQGLPGSERSSWRAAAASVVASRAPRLDAADLVRLIGTLTEDSRLTGNRSGSGSRNGPGSGHIPNQIRPEEEIQQNLRLGDIAARVLTRCVRFLNYPSTSSS